MFESQFPSLSCLHAGKELILFLLLNIECKVMAVATVTFNESIPGITPSDGCIVSITSQAARKSSDIPFISLPARK